MTSSFAIPKTPQDITVAFLKQALHEQPWSKYISSFSYNQNSMQGQCSNVQIFSLNYTEEADVSQATFPKEIVLKFASNGSGFVTREHLVKLGAYKKEIGFYKFLLNTKKDLQMIPPIYYAEIDTQDKDQFLLIMKKVGSPMDQLDLFSISDGKTVLKNLAKFHATFWYLAAEESQFFASLLKDGMLVTTPIFSYIGVQFVNAERPVDYESPEALLADVNKMWPSKWQAFAEALEHYAVEKKMTKLQENLKVVSRDFATGKMLSRLERTFETYKSKNRTLVHADYRPDNFLKEENGNILVVDFQGICFGNCSHDVLNFLAHSFNDHQHVYELIQGYWNELVQANPDIEKSYSLKELVEDVKYASLIQVVAMTFYLAVWKDMLDKGMDVPTVMGQRVFDLMLITSARAINLYTTFFAN